MNSNEKNHLSHEWMNENDKTIQPINHTAKIWAVFQWNKLAPLFFLVLYHQHINFFIKILRKSDFGGFQLPEVRKIKVKIKIKITRFIYIYMWFSLCSQTYRRMIQVLYFIFSIKARFG